MRFPPNGPFYLPQQPAEGDHRPRNAFGFLLEFAEAKRAYYERLDREKAEQALSERQADETPTL